MQVNSPVEGVYDYSAMGVDRRPYVLLFTPHGVVVDWQVASLRFTMDGIEDNSMQTVLRLGLPFPAHVVGGLRALNNCALASRPDFSAAAIETGEARPAPMRLGFASAEKGNSRLIMDMAQAKDPARFLPGVTVSAAP